MTSLAGVRVVVTGAAQGMGLAHCRYFAKEGARVAALDIDTAQLERSRRELAEEGLEILTLNCDVARRADVERAIEEVGSRLGGIDAIVSNAGTIHTVQGLEDTDDDDWDRTLAVHVGGARNLCRASLPWLRRSEHPRIVIISSMWAQRGGGFGYAYCAAKPRRRTRSGPDPRQCHRTRQRTDADGGRLRPRRDRRGLQVDPDGALGRGRRDLQTRGFPFLQRCVVSHGPDDRHQRWPDHRRVLT
jgi:nucleoside-diphosphate-sugar epimerase